MRLTIAYGDDKVTSVELDSTETLETLKAVIEAETGVPAAQQLLSADGNLLNNESQTLEGCLLAEGDLIMLMQQEGGGAEQAVPQEAGALLEWIRSHPQIMSQLRGGFNPPLLQAVEAGDTARVKQIFDDLQRLMAQQQDARRAEEERKRQEEAELWNADMFDAAAQAKIAERINQQQIDHNLEQAWQHNPEIFTQVDMLYVNLEVNRHTVAAFVDSGAQITIVGFQTAHTLGIAHLIDKRYGGIAKGVGSGKIVGRIHQAPMQVGGEYLAVSLTVMETDDMPFLFGLDMLRRHQAQIDLKDNVLRFTHLGVALPFLPPHQIPAGAIGRPKPQEENQPGDSGAGPSSVPSAPSSAPNGGAAAAAKLAGAAATARAAAGAPAPGAAAPTSPSAAAAKSAAASAGGSGSGVGNTGGGGGDGVGTTGTGGHGGGTGAASEQQRQEELRRQAAALVSGLLSSTRLPVPSPAARSSAPAQAPTPPSPMDTPAPVTPTAAAPAAVPNEAKVQQLVGMGFPRELVEEALIACEGDVNQAASFLYGF